MHLSLPTAALVTGALALASLTVVSTGAAEQAAAPSAVATAEVHDETVRTDADGFRYTVDPAPAPPTGYLAEARRSPSSTSQAGLAVPVLNSRSSTHSVYLDFDGVDLPGSSAWAQAQSPEDDVIAAGAYTGFTLDGSQDFNQAEVDFIEKTWRIVAEKFAPYDVNVTTVDPGSAGLARTSSSDTAYGVQVVITDDPSPVTQICSNACAGIAYNGLFDGWYPNGPNPDVFVNSTSYSIAWVFSSKTYGSAQMTALDAAHEIGHTLGLNHDGGSANPSYYGGHENWVPIMGLTNQRAVSQFSKGEYTGANNSQDDLAVIALNGDSHAAGSLTLADDFTTSSGTPAGPAVRSELPPYTLNGVIGSAADDDVFTINQTCTDPLTATATGIGSGQSVDLKVEILDSTGGTVLATNDPPSGQTSQVGDVGSLPTGLNATATSSAATSYRVRVDGVGSGNELNTGYSDYGSIGRYALKIEGCTTGGPGQTAPGAPATAAATPNPRTSTGTVTWTAPTSTGGSPITGYQITGLPGGTKNVANPAATSYPATGLVPGTTYSLAVHAKNAVGTSATGTSTTLRVATWAPTTKPVLGVTRSGTTANLSWTTPANPGGATLTGWLVDRTGPGAAPADRTVSTTSTAMTGLAVGAHTFRVRATYTADDTAGVLTSDPKPITVTTPPSAPRIGKASSGAKGGKKNAAARWAAPSSSGGATITGYRVVAYKIVGGKATRTYTSKALSGSTRKLVFSLPKGSYRFRVVAYNGAGASPGSAYSATVKSR